MGLRDDAARDFRAICGDSSGFGVSLELRNPAGQQGTIVGLTSDVSLAVDPETGASVALRRVSVALSLLALDALGIGRPVATVEPQGLPWRVRYREPGQLAARVYRVVETLPDASIAGVLLQLEEYDGTF